MRFSVSSLSFVDGNIVDMAALEPKIGVEIFVEWVPDGFWDRILPKILAGREGALSLHAPFNAVDPTAQGEDGAVLRPLIEPLSLCSRYAVDSYVVHTNPPFAQELSPADASRRRERVARRLKVLDHLTREAGTVLLVENLGFGSGRKHLYDLSQFLDIFAEAPALSCIVDVGHALVEGYDIPTLQRTLGARIKAYHLHDNDGSADSHWRLGQGCLDITCLISGIRQYTPDATLVLEYAKSISIADYSSDMALLQQA